MTETAPAPNTTPVTATLHGPMNDDVNTDDKLDVFKVAIEKTLPSGAKVTRCLRCGGAAILCSVHILDEAEEDGIDEASKKCNGIEIVIVFPNHEAMQTWRKDAKVKKLLNKHFMKWDPPSPALPAK